MEDEPLMIENLMRLLEPLASQIDSTEELAPALQMSVHGRYNVIILDLRLKNTDKSEALKAVPEFKRNNSAVVVVSGRPDPNLKEEVLAAGADAFVPKDSNFTRRALLMATNVATLKLPKGSYKSDSYLQHVEMLRKLAEETTE